jgi:hypothetical protein
MNISPMQLKWKFKLPAAYKSDIVTVIRLTLNRTIDETEPPVGLNK